MQRDWHLMKISVVVSHSPLIMTIAHGLHHFNIRLHSTSINFYAQNSEVPSLIEDFRNQTAYVSILTYVWGFVVLLIGKKTEVLTTSCSRVYSILSTKAK